VRWQQKDGEVENCRAPTHPKQKIWPSKTPAQM